MNQLDGVKNYLNTQANKMPFFLFVVDDQYAAIKNELLSYGLDVIRLSDYCSDGDKLPDIDGLIDRITTTESSGQNKNLVVLGLGEYLALRGSEEAEKVLSRLKDLPIGDTKVMLLLRQLSSQVARLRNDVRFDSRRHVVIGNTPNDLSLTLVDPSVGLPVETGFKSMLSKLENGASGNIVLKTTLKFDASMFIVHRVDSAFDGVKFAVQGFGLSRCCGNDAQWAELLSELNQNNASLQDVFEKYGLSENLDTEFYHRVSGDDFRNWLYFIALKCLTGTLRNGYLRFVLNMTNRFEDIKSHVLDAIIDVPHDDERFAKFYDERKLLLEKFPESDIASFVVRNQIKPVESIYKLTDGTKTEREEIIAWVSKYGMIPQIAEIYPALNTYLKQYIFQCGELSFLTDYFDCYKKQKVHNRLEQNFLAKVDELAIDRKYNLLKTRNEIIEGFTSDETFLFLVDALGVEYLAYISELARQRGLSISISIARSELPTITSFNCSIFDDWSGQKEKCNALDEIKHKDEGGYNFTNNKLPIHLVKELDIIAEIVERAATKLASRVYKRFLIVSDHGASRLAVLHHKEEKYETNTKGEHSGRCCKTFEPYDLPFAAEENGYIVLADYGRFKGSRAANVEVHGGASLEEVIVPIIELKLKDAKITVQLMDEIAITDTRSGTKIVLFFNSHVENVSVILNGVRYQAIKGDSDYHYSVNLDAIKRAGEYMADVYTGDDLVDQIRIKTRGKSAKVNDDAFDDLF